MMTSEQLDALQAAAEAATPGPWEAESVVTDTMAGPLREYGIVGVAPLSEYFDSDPWHMALDSLDEEDASFIAAANPAVVLELVAAHRAALARIARVEALLPKWGAERAKNAEMFSSGGIGMMTAIDYSGDLERALTEGEPDAG